MAVQIPTVQRNAPVPEPSVGRVDIKPLDISSAQSVIRGATNQLVNATANAFEEHQLRAANNIGKDAAYKYNKALREVYEGKAGENGQPGTLGIKYADGEPTPLYQQFDKTMKDKYDEVMGQYDGASDKVKFAIKSQLDQVKTKFSDIAISSHAAQLDKWQTSVATNTVAMAKEDILDQTAYFNPNDPKNPNPYLDFDNTLARINQTWMEHGKDRGTVKEVIGKDGKPLVNDRGEKTYIPHASVAFRIAKDKSDAIENVINNLRTSGKVDEAVAVAEHYKDVIDAAARPKINKELEDAKLDKNAFAELTKVQQLPLKQAEIELKKITDKPLQEKALDKFVTYKSKMERLDDMQSDTFYKTAFDQLLTKQSGGEPFATVDEMLSNPTFKPLIEGITKPEQVKALTAMIKPKEETDPQANIDFMSDAVNGNLNGISKEQLTLKLAPIAKKDQRWALDLYKFVNMDTESEKRSRLNSSMSKLKQAMELQKVIDREIPGRGFAPKDADLLSTAMQELSRSVGEIPQDATQQQLWIDNFTADFKKRVTPGRLQEFIDNTFGATIKATKEAMGLGEERPLVSPRTGPITIQPTNAPIPQPGMAPQPPKVLVSPTPFKTNATPTPAGKSLSGITSRQLMKMYLDKYPDRKNKVPSIEELQQFQNEISK